MTRTATSEAFTILCHSDDPEWPELRKGGVGGSDSPILCGQSTYGSWIKLAAVKSGQVPEWEGNEITRAGHRMEAPIAEWALEEMKKRGAPYGYLIRSTDVEWLQCTPDWVVYDQQEDGSPVIVPFQIKNTNWKAGEWEDGVPPGVLVQVQHEMLCFGAPWAYVAVLLTGNRLRWSKIMPDHHIQDQILDQGADFMHRMEAGIDMPVDGSEHTRKALFAMHPDDNGATIALSAELMEVARELDELKAEEKITKAALGLASNRLKAAMGANTFATFPDGTGFSFKTQEANRKPTPASVVKSRVLRRQGV